MIHSRTTYRFRECFAELPSAIQEEAVKAYRPFKENPGHPGLQFKKVAPDTYSVRIGLGFRALGALKGNTIAWFWVGSHGEYDKLI